MLQPLDLWQCTVFLISTFPIFLMRSHFSIGFFLILLWTSYFYCNMHNLLCFADAILFLFIKMSIQPSLWEWDVRVLICDWSFSWFSPRIPMIGLCPMIFFLCVARVLGASYIYLAICAFSTSFSDRHVELLRAYLGLPQCWAQVMPKTEKEHLGINSNIAANGAIYQWCY
jgi:hypothetical protein